MNVRCQCCDICRGERNSLVTSYSASNISLIFLVLHTSSTSDHLCHPNATCKIPPSPPESRTCSLKICSSANPTASTLNASKTGLMHSSEKLMIVRDSRVS
jgi:hypothetical protein